MLSRAGVCGLPFLHRKSNVELSSAASALIDLRLCVSA